MLAQEIEVKLYVKNLAAVENRLKELGASLVMVRLHENNLRFDTPAGELTRQKRVLRLRQDVGAYLTYKGEAKPDQEVSNRDEIEVQVNDFAAARQLLESLGFQVSVTYEKYRTTYVHGELKITLDEMPFGDFIEVEGPNATSIRKMVELLGLDWAARSKESYMEIFRRVKAAKGLDFRDLTFDNFSGISLTGADLGLRLADASAKPVAKPGK